MRTHAGALLIASLLVSACGFQRAQLAKDAPNLMMGASKDQVLACMGQPANKSTAGTAEVWSYNSSSGSVEPFETGGEQSLAPTARRPSPTLCTVNITLVGGRVSKVSYTGPDGEAMAASQHCAYALEDCLK
jgi:outer membrane protein assembly factor BamE (lipoprotein component of BamABCDE complex)